MVPRIPQLDVVVDVYLVQCHLGPRMWSSCDRRPSGPNFLHVKAISLLSSQHDQEYVTFTIELLHDLVPHQLLEFPWVSVVSLPTQWTIHLGELLEVVISCT